jgi:hypothetical protein
MCKGNRCTPVTLEPADHIPESATGTLWHLFRDSSSDLQKSLSRRGAVAVNSKSSPRRTREYYGPESLMPGVRQAGTKGETV